MSSWEAGGSFGNVNPEKSVKKCSPKKTNNLETTAAFHLHGVLILNFKDASLHKFL